MRRSSGWASSVRGALGARAIWRIALAGLAVVGGCATGQKTASAPPDEAVDLNSGGRTSNRTTVVVDNQNLNEMTIYAYQGTQRLRLGRARGSATTEIRIPSSLLSGLVELRFYAVFWLIYGLALMDWPLITSNVVTLALMSVIVTLKLRHG